MRADIPSVFWGDSCDDSPEPPGPITVPSEDIVAPAVEAALLLSEDGHLASWTNVDLRVQGECGLRLHTALCQGLPARSRPVESADATGIGGPLRLPRPYRRIVQCLAAIGEQIPLQKLGELADPLDDLAPAVEAAVESGLVTWHPGEGRVSVPEPVRLLVVAAMSARETGFAHRWAARHTQGATALLHRAAAACGSDEGLARRLEAEARHLDTLGRPRRAAELLRRASDVSAEVGPAARRQSESVELSLRAHDLAHARRALAAMEPDAARHRALAGRLAVLEGRIGEGAARLGEAHRELLLADADAREGQEAAAVWATQARWLAGCPAGELRRMLAETRPSSCAAPYWEGERRRLDAVLVAAAEGPGRGLRILAAGPAPSPSTETRGRAAVTEAWLRLEAGDTDGCEAAVRTACGGALPGEGDHVREAALTVQGHALWLRAEWNLAEANGRLVAASSSPLWQMRGRALLSLIGAAREGVAQGATAEEERPEPSVLGAAARLFHALVVADAAGGSAAAEILRSPEHRVGRDVLAGPLLPWRKIELARAAVATGNDTLTSALVASMRAESVGAPSWVRACALWLEARAAERTGSREVIARLYARADAEAVALEAAAPWYYARYQTDHANFLAALGSRRAAADRYRAACAVAERLGAAPLRERCTAGLRSLRVPQGEEAFGLTARESEVARLVSSGLTNREVAACLFVTPASVAFHLGNIYGKLGVRSRYELRRRWTRRHGG